MSSTSTLPLYLTTAPRFPRWHVHCRWVSLPSSPLPKYAPQKHRTHLGIRLFHLGSPDMRSQRHALCASPVSRPHQLIPKRHIVSPSPRTVASLSPSSRLYAPTTPLFTRPVDLFGHLQPSDYPLSPFKMKFDPPLFHPNSTPPILSPNHPGYHIHPRVFSLPRRYRMHINPAHPGRRSDHVRTSVGTLESRSERRKGPS